MLLLIIAEKVYHHILVKKQIKVRRNEFEDILGGLAEVDTQIQDIQKELKDCKKVKHSA